MPGFSMNRYGVYGEQTIVPAAMTVTHQNAEIGRVGLH
jgi:hypothetical protein